MREFTLYFDGSCEPTNPGGVATAGWVLKEGTLQIAAGSKEICRGPKATNNVAEYAALGFGLRHILDNFGGTAVDTLHIRGDSKLVVEQVARRWKCNKEHLAKLRDRCLELLEQIGCKWDSTWIPREQNTEADALSQSAYVAATGNAYPRRRA